MFGKLRSRLKCLVIIFGFIAAIYVFLPRVNDPTTFSHSACETRYDSVGKSDYVVKIIHQSWKSKIIPKMFQRLSKSWTLHCFKHWTYMFWTDEDNANLIRKHYPWFLNRYLALPGNIYRADVSRYFYMFHYGGLYTDLDNECLRPFEHLLINHSLVFGAMVGQWRGTNLKEGYVQNSFMYSKPRHEFWLDMIFHCFNVIGRSRPEEQTGPILLSRLLQQFRDRNCIENELRIYPANYFNPISWLNRTDVDDNCQVLTHMSDKQLQICRSSIIAKRSYVVQYHAHTWE